MPNSRVEAKKIRKKTEIDNKIPILRRDSLFMAKIAFWLVISTQPPHKNQTKLNHMFKL